MADVEITIETIDKNSEEIKKVAEKLKQVGVEAAKARQETEKIGTGTKRTTEDLTKLGGSVNDWISKLRAATPANIEFSNRLNDITKAYEDGKIGADEARRSIEGIKNEMLAARPAGEKFGSALKGLIGIAGGAAGAAMALKAMSDQMWEIGKQGAQVSQTAESFGVLIDQLGLMPDLLDKLRSASRGTVDDMSLMSSTITLLAGTDGDLAQALGNATPRLLEIAKAANKLNPALGDTNFMFQSLALGIKRGSPMIIDNLGITLKIGEANEKYAKALGKTVEELTSAELKQALLNEVLDKGGILIEQAGGKADAAADSFARLQAAQTNMANKLKSDVAPTLASLAEFMLEQNQVADDWGGSWMNIIPALGGVRQAAAAVYALFADNTSVVEESTDVQKDNTAATEEAARQYYGLSNAVDQTQQYYAILSDQAERSMEKQKEIAEFMPEFTDTYKNLSGAMLDMQEAEAGWMESTGKDVASQLESAGVKGEKYKDALGAIDDVYDTTLGLQQQYKEDLAALVGEYRKTGDLEKFKQGLQDIKDVYMPLNEQISEAIQKVTEFKRLWDLLESKAISLDVDVPVLPGYGAGGGNTSGVGSQEKTYGQDINGNGVIGAFNGLDMTVPPGHPTDSFLIAARSGEEVKITPPGRAPDDAQQTQETVIKIEAHLYYPIDEEKLLLRMAETIRRRQ